MCTLPQGSEHFSATSNRLRVQIAQLESALVAHRQAKTQEHNHLQRLVTVRRHMDDQRARQIGGRETPSPEATIGDVDALLSRAVATLHEATGILQAYQTQIQQLNERLVESIEAERQHLARELHDELGQTLTGLSLSLSVAERIAPDRLSRQLTDARSQVSTLIAQVRQRSLELRPAILDDLGLHAALQWLIARYREQTGIVIDAQIEGLEQRYAPLYELTAYRITQEALTNIARHAGVSHATLQAWADDERMIITVEDRGRGFDVATKRATHESSGLVSMWERAILLGGDLMIESVPGAGTRLQAYLPLVPPA